MPNSQSYSLNTLVTTYQGQDPQGDITEQNQAKDLQYHTISQAVPIPYTYKKIASMNSGTNTFRLVTFGDSYGQKLMSGIWTDIQKLFKGWQGSYFIGSQNGITNNSTTGSVTDNTADFSRWVSGITTTFGVGGTRTYGLGGAAAYCNKIKIYYVQEPSAGTFKVQMDGADQSGYTNVNAANATTQIGIITLTPTLGNHTASIVGLTGSVNVIGVGFENTSQNGVVIINVAQGGIPLNVQTTTAWNIFTSFLADVQPDLMTFEMKEDSSYYATSLNTFFTAVQSGWKYMDIVGIGSPPVSVNDADQVIQNAQLRAACLNYGAVYWDSYKIFGSYQRLVDLGWNGDGTHVSSDCDAFRGSLMLRDLGLAQLKGMPAYRDADLANLVFRKQYNENTAGTIQAEPSFGLDLQVKLNRSLLIVDNNGNLISQFDPTPANSWIPNNTRIGSASNPSFVSDDVNTISVRQGGTQGSYGNFRGSRVIADKLSVTNAVSGVATLGSLSKKIEVFDANGNSLGFVPVYATIS